MTLKHRCPQITLTMKRRSKIQGGLIKMVDCQIMWGARATISEIFYGVGQFCLLHSIHVLNEGRERPWPALLKEYGALMLVILGTYCTGKEYCLKVNKRKLGPRLRESWTFLRQISTNYITWPLTWLEYSPEQIRTLWAFQ